MAAEASRRKLSTLGQCKHTIYFHRGRACSGRETDKASNTAKVGKGREKTRGPWRVGALSGEE
eukprot:1549468-Pleurochrysis_carterae.AAC.2